MQVKRLKSPILFFIDSLLNSYSQVFFSHNKVFAILLIVATLLSPLAGLSGLLAIAFTNGFAWLIGLKNQNIRNGYYGFNVLLMAIGLGVYYQPNAEYFLLLAGATILTVFLTVSFEGVITKYGLPYLSIPFLLGLWMAILATREFVHLEVSEGGVYMLNDLYRLGGQNLVNIYLWFGDIQWAESIAIYFKSLGAIFFQFTIFAGILIALGLLIYSRIALLLSIIGFYAAYLYHHFIGADISELGYSYIGFNYILTAIAVGGFFVIPSVYSIIWVIVLTPIISITITSFTTVFSVFQLPIFSLPFNLVVLSFLYILKFRQRHYNHPEIVFYQQFSPELNLYTQHNNKARFNNFLYQSICLPFFGQWKISQAHNGDITHKGMWRHAWDFIIVDDQGKQHKDSGKSLTDYYCYNKPVCAPADGWIEEVVDNVPDNEPGEVNLKQNWGNTIIIKHSENLYTKISHLIPDTAKVKKGDVVRQNDVLGYVGNSGRSPYPHIHFQIQETPYIGSVTLEHPISDYILHKNDHEQYKKLSIPKNGDVVSAIEKDEILSKAIRFVPGQNINFEVDDNGQKTSVVFQCHTDAFNHTYLLCTKTEAKAWFVSNDAMTRFTHFKGTKKSLLYVFYLGMYKITTGIYKNIEITDLYPVFVFNNSIMRFLQDFVAPIYIFMQATYRMKFVKHEKYFSENRVKVLSSAHQKFFRKMKKKYTFNISITNSGFEEFIVHYNNKKIIARQQKVNLEN